MKEKQNNRITYLSLHSHHHIPPLLKFVHRQHAKQKF